MMRLNDATGVILAGGRGTRLRSVVSDRPKILAEVNGRPFLSYLLDQVADSGIKKVVLCVGYRGDQVQSTFGLEYAGMSIAYSQEKELLGTGGALQLAFPLIESETFIAMNGDSFCEVNFGDLWNWHHVHQANATVVLTKQLDTVRYGRVSISSDDAIVGFEEKGTTNGPGWINAGIYVFSIDVVRSIKASSLEHDVFPGLVGQRFYGYQNYGRFLDIGTPESYAQADSLFAGK